jgi:glycosyltransferase involved in cell wall biosynthesis
MDCFHIEPSRMNSTVSLFYAGSFGGKKEGLSILLDAFDRLAESRKNIRLVLTGKGDSEAMKMFFSRLETSPYKGRVEYMGYLDDNEYYSALNSADIPCMTRADYEYNNAGFPFKLGEFLATGKPVIASRVSDIDRFLVDRQNAMLVRPGDSYEIFKAAEYLIDNPESAEAIGARGREAAESFFDHRQQGKALLAFLESV